MVHFTKQPLGITGFWFQQTKLREWTIAVLKKVFHPMSLRHFELKTASKKPKFQVILYVCIMCIEYTHKSTKLTYQTVLLLTSASYLPRFLKVTYAVEKSCKQVQIYSESITKTVFLVTQACEYSYIKQRAYRNSQILEANSHKINSLLYVLQNHSQLFNLRDINLNKNKLLT